LFTEEKNSFEESLQNKDISNELDSTLANKLTYQHNSFIYMEGISNIGKIFRNSNYNNNVFFIYL